MEKFEILFNFPQVIFDAGAENKNAEIGFMYENDNGNTIVFMTFHACANSAFYVCNVI